MFHNKKRTRDESHHDNTQFPYQNFLTYLFAPVTQKKADQLLWQPGIALAIELVQLVEATVTRLGVTDHDAIYSLLCDLLTSDGMDQLHQGRTNHQAYAKKFADRVQPRLALLKSCDHVAVLQHFFLEPSTSIKQYMMIFWNNLAEEKFDPAYLPDWIAIYRFFLNKDQVEVYFHQLESELQNYCAHLPRRLQPPQRADGKFILSDPIKSPYQRFKILSGYLYQWAQQNGFSQQAKLIRQLSKESFLNLLHTKTFFKDRSVNVGNQHGAWSHALQWYCLIEHQKQTNFLRHDPLQLYQQLGGASQYSTIHDNLWEILCDTVNPARYISPEAFTITMHTSPLSQQLPLLSESIKRLQRKMDTKYDSKGRHMLKMLLKKHEDEEIGGVVITPFKTCLR